jgi:hypothetical protein
MELVLVFGLFGLFILFNVGWLIWRWQRPPVILERWADRNGYRIVDQSYCWFWAGPFFMRCGRGQMVYRITVEDEDGERWKGHVRLGHWLIGLLSDEVAEAWDAGHEPSRRYRYRGRDDDRPPRSLPSDSATEKWGERPRRDRRFREDEDR